MRSLLCLGLAATLALGAAALYGDDEKEADTKEAKIELKDVKCLMNPKAGAKEDKFVEYKNGKVFFCCDNCPKGFTAGLKDDEKKEMLMVKANAQMFATKQAKQDKCPLTGRDLNKDHKVKVAGVEMTFCCPGCKGKVEKAEGDEQLKLVFNDKAFDKHFKLPKKKGEEDKEEKVEEKK